MSVLGIVGTAAMLWVGGGIIVHGLEHFGFDTLPHFIDELAEMAQGAPAIGAIAGWFTFATCAAVVGLAIGGIIVAVVHVVTKGKH
jgi:hypothetical protein